MKSLKSYIRSSDPDKINGVVRSVNLTPDQAAWVKAQNVNLSKLVRDVIESLMAKNKVG